MKHIPFLFFLSLLLIFASCHKNDSGGPTIVSGTIVENGSLKPIAHAEVWLTAQSRGSTWSGGLGGGASGSRYQKSDSTGHFSFSFTTSNDTVYGIWVRANPKLYFEGPVGEDGNLSNGKDTKNRIVRVDPKGWIKFKVINEAPMDTVTELHIQGSFNPSFTFGELSKDTISVGEGVGNNKALIWIHIVRKMSSITDIKDTVILTPLDTVLYTVKY